MDNIGHGHPFLIFTTHVFAFVYMENRKSFGHQALGLMLLAFY
jgi:hypothetical protein